MRKGRWIVVLRSLIAALMLALGLVNLTSGRIVVGVLLVGLAVMNVTLTVTTRRRRARLLERFPRLGEAAAGRRRVPKSGRVAPTSQLADA